MEQSLRGQPHEQVWVRHHGIFRGVFIIMDKAKAMRGGYWSITGIGRWAGQSTFKNPSSAGDFSPGPSHYIYVFCVICLECVWISIDSQLDPLHVNVSSDILVSDWWVKGFASWTHLYHQRVRFVLSGMATALEASSSRKLDS